MALFIKLRNNVYVTKGELETFDTMLFEQVSIATKAELKKAYGKIPLREIYQKYCWFRCASSEISF
jgi:hypothetical protein